MKLQTLTETEEKFYRIFRSYKSFARKEELSRAGFSEEEQKALAESLVNKGYLSANKLGHLKETAEAQKARLGGLTAKQYVEESRARMRAQEAAAWASTFGRN
jgi:hypothetical protein